MVGYVALEMLHEHCANSTSVETLPPTAELDVSRVAQLLLLSLAPSLLRRLPLLEPPLGAMADVERTSVALPVTLPVHMAAAAHLTATVEALTVIA